MTTPHFLDLCGEYAFYPEKADRPAAAMIEVNLSYDNIGIKHTTLVSGSGSIAVTLLTTQ